MGSSISKYVLPGLETVGGGASEIFAPGNPIGLSLMGAGLGQLAGTAAGSPSLGGMLGGLGGMAGGLGGPSLWSKLFGGASGATQAMDAGATVGSQAPSKMTEKDIGPSDGNKAGPFSEGQPSTMTEVDLPPSQPGLGATSIVGGEPTGQSDYLSSGDRMGGLAGMLGGMFADPFTMMVLGPVLGNLMQLGGQGGGQQQAPMAQGGSPRAAMAAPNGPASGVRGTPGGAGIPSPAVPSSAPSMSARSPYEGLLGGSEASMSMAPPPGTMSATPQNPGFMDAFSQAMGTGASAMGPMYGGLIAYLRSQGMI